MYKEPNAHQPDLSDILPMIELVRVDARLEELASLSVVLAGYPQAYQRLLVLQREREQLERLLGWDKYK